MPVDQHPLHPRMPTARPFGLRRPAACRRTLRSEVTNELNAITIDWAFGNERFGIRDVVCQILNLGNRSLLLQNRSRLLLESNGGRQQKSATQQPTTPAPERTVQRDRIVGELGSKARPRRSRRRGGQERRSGAFSCRWSLPGRVGGGRSLTIRRCLRSTIA